MPDKNESMNGFYDESRWHKHIALRNGDACEPPIIDKSKRVYTGFQGIEFSRNDILSQRKNASRTWNSRKRRVNIWAFLQSRPKSLGQIDLRYKLFAMR